MDPATDPLRFRFGANAFIHSEDANQMQVAMNTMDVIIDVGAKAHSLQPYIAMLKTHGKLIALGSPNMPNSLPNDNSLVGGRKTVSGSTIAGRGVEWIKPAAMNTMDGIIDVGAKAHSLQPYIAMLKTRGKLIALGSPNMPNLLPNVNSLVSGRKTVAGSTIGGLKETQKVIDFAAKHNIAADIELIPMDYFNIAIERMEKVVIRYRFVIDVGKTLSLMNLPIGDVYIMPPNTKGTPTTKKDSCCCQYL